MANNTLERSYDHRGPRPGCQRTGRLTLHAASGASARQLN
jgi:hypothetical protein